MTTVTSSPEIRKHLFVEHVLPVVERHARIAFRHLRYRADDHADAVADCLAHAWEGFVFAVRSGKEPWLFPSMLATFAARKTKVGRKVGKRERAKDVFNAGRAKRVTLGYLEDQDGWQDAVKDNTETSPPEQVAFRLDFPAWLNTLSERDRKIAKTLAIGHSAKDVARLLELSQGRMTQLRQQLMDEWNAFTE